jgi:predicted glycoside hydrolase/deacetylase ChbG (UPF0249 family)
VKKRLIVNADDYARSPEINAGILEAHLHGIVTTTTVLINMPGSVEAVREAGETAPDLGIGLHLNLTLGEPCYKNLRTSTLVGAGREFHPIHHWHEILDEVPLNLIESEWRAQIDQMLDSGVIIDHLDSHHHIAAIRADMWELFLELAQEMGCGVRPPYPDDISDQDMQQSFPMRMIHNARNVALPTLHEHAVPHPDYFLASFFDEGATLAHLLDIIATLPAGISELMCHPGYSSDELEATSGYTQRRVIELEALTSVEAIQHIMDEAVELVTYRQVWPSNVAY